MDNKTIEKRSYSFDIRTQEKNDESDEKVIGVLSGRPIVYDRVTDIGCFDEVIEKGALNDADLTDVRFLINHDISRIPLARSRRNNGNSTMHMIVDDQGLLLEKVELDIENNADAKALYAAVKRGDITGMSFCFTVDDEEWTDIESDHPTRHVKQIGTVIEVSAVTYPAYEDTDIQARSALDNARAALDKAKNRSVDTDGNKLELLKMQISLMGGR